MRDALVLATLLSFSCSTRPAEAEPVAPSPPTEDAPVSIAASVQPASVVPGGDATLWLRFATLPAWHIDPPEADAATALHVQLAPTPHVHAGAWRFPAAAPGPEDPRPVLAGDFAASCPLRLAPDAPRGRHELRVTVTYVACDPFRCNPPVHSVVAATLEVR